MKDKDKKKGGFRLKNVLKAIGGVGGDILGLVGDLTGVEAIEKASDIIKGSKELSPEQKEALLEAAKEDMEYYKMQLQDISNARDMYDKSQEQADRLSNQIMKWNIWAILGMLILNVGVLIASDKFKFDNSIVLIVGNTIGFIIQSLINERGQVTGFYFGSSLGSKQKDKKVIVNG